ncbi:molybdopterin-guanine dinucleotide biosynthesis protein MobB [Tatumella terrea]|uniref:Molybdopterin-guanine dinucleotide biosynthesis protein MobB n=1 Tax=Tatumella terrea TaxID=419007 RepID=A0ABW1VSI0_9GAMM|nr:molybdopterin-guanine dinucleotide biosynthesis protein MobB [Tatumella sp. JGM118]MBS0911150.1 molybdopterin-guanine dinucleotide biosynthesis protein B [Tatumella sp. JGM118]
MSLPILGISAGSGTGKTTLLKKLIPLLQQQGIRPGLIKHTHHQMDIDYPGKDSYELRKAGAGQVMVASRERWALMSETPQDPPELTELARHMSQETLDIILVEGFRQEPIPKLVLWRNGCTGTPHALIDEYTLALVSDTPTDGLPVNWLNINQPALIAEFIGQWWCSQREETRENQNKR